MYISWHLTLWRRGGTTRCSSPGTHCQTCTQFKLVMRAEHTQPPTPGPTIAGTEAHGLKSPGLTANIRHFCPWRASPGKQQGAAGAGSRECWHYSRCRALPELAAPQHSALDRPGRKGKAALFCTPCAGGRSPDLHHNVAFKGTEIHLKVWVSGGKSSSVPFGKAPFLFNCLQN